MEGGRMVMTARRDDRPEAGMPAGVLCILALGSNLGDRRGHLSAAVAQLAESRGVRVEALSRVVESEPWGPVPQGRYLNLLVRARVQLDAEALLALAQRIEAAAGRDRSVRYGPRTLDIDIIFFGELVLDTPSLTLPHPFWRERPFVHDLLSDIVLDGAGELPHSGVREALRTGGALSPELQEVDSMVLTNLPGEPGDRTGGLP